MKLVTFTDGQDSVSRVGRIADDLVIEHARLRIQAELDWHQLVLNQLGKLTASTADPAARR